MPVASCWFVVAGSRPAGGAQGPGTAAEETQTKERVAGSEEAERRKARKSGAKAAGTQIDAGERAGIVALMKAKFTAIIEAAPAGGYWAICPEVPGANGQGETVAAAKKSLRDAIRLIFEDRITDARRGLPEDAIQTEIAV
jgi:predicted RNase H-like HicB family nuclease